MSETSPEINEFLKVARSAITFALTTSFGKATDMNVHPTFDRTFSCGSLVDQYPAGWPCFLGSLPPVS